MRVARTFGTSTLRTVSGATTARISAPTALYAFRTKRLLASKFEGNEVIANFLKISNYDSNKKGNTRNLYCLILYTTSNTKYPDMNLQIYLRKQYAAIHEPYGNSGAQDIPDKVFELTDSCEIYVSVIQNLLYTILLHVQL